MEAAQKFDDVPQGGWTLAEAWRALLGADAVNELAGVRKAEDEIPPEERRYKLLSAYEAHRRGMVHNPGTAPLKPAYKAAHEERTRLERELYARFREALNGCAVRARDTGNPAFPIPIEGPVLVRCRPLIGAGELVFRAGKQRITYFDVRVWPAGWGEDANTGSGNLPVKRGRPPTYDWGAALREFVRVTNTPDGLPEKQADMIRHLQEWFMRTEGREPSKSMIESHVSEWWPRP
jgi:hypothetical protein